MNNRNNNRCVYCNEIIPEGRQICINCEHNANKETTKMNSEWIASGDGCENILKENY